LSFLFLLFGVEISAVNVYALVRRLVTQAGRDANNHKTTSIRYAPGCPHRPLSSLLRSSLWEYSTASRLF
jgi:hypothetical protein